MRAVIETLLLDTLYDLPTDAEGRRFVISKEMVEGDAPVLPQPAPAAAKPAKRRKRESA